MRPGLAYLVQELRRLVNDVNSTTWEDAKIANTLDRCRSDFWRLPAVLLHKLADKYYITFYITYLESRESGPDYFRLYDSNNNELTNDQIFLYDYVNGVFVTSVYPCYLDCKSYDLAFAASLLWNEKAGYLQDSFDFEADGANFKRSQEVEHCLKMAEFYRKLAKPTTSFFRRIDVI